MWLLRILYQKTLKRFLYITEPWILKRIFGVDQMAINHYWSILTQHPIWILSSHKVECLVQICWEGILWKEWGANIFHFEKNCLIFRIFIQFLNISTLTFRILHFKVYDILKCKIFLIGFLNGLSNFKQTVKLHFTAMDPFYFFENSNFKPYTQFLLPLEHGKHWSKMMVCPKTPIIESECSLSVCGILRFWGQKQKLNLTSILVRQRDKRTKNPEKEMVTLCSIGKVCSKEYLSNKQH